MRLYRHLAVVTSALLGLSGLAAPSEAAPTAPTAPTVAALTPAATAAPAPGSYHGVARTRVLDTRTSGAVPARRIRGAQVAGVGSIPPTGVTAVAMTVTVLSPAQTGSASIYPSGTSWNGSATISFPAGATFQQVVTEDLGRDGALVIRNDLGVAANFVFDVVGYYLGGSSVVAGGYQSVVQRRLYDSRPTPSKVLGAAVTTTIRDPGLAGASAAVLDLTVVGPTRPGSLAAYAGGTRWSGSTDVNYRPGSNSQTFLTVPVGSGGEIAIRNSGPVGVEVVADLVGFFAAGTPSVAGTFTPLGRGRQYDSRSPGTPAFGGDSEIEVVIDGATSTIAPVGSAPDVGVTAALIRLTVLTPPRAGSVTVFDSDKPFPGNASASFAAGPTAQAIVVANLDGSGAIHVRNNTHSNLSVVVDVVGFYRDRAAAGFTTGKSMPADPPDSGLRSVQCPQVDFCVAWMGNSVVYYDGSTWSSPQAWNFRTESLSCASSTFCLAIGAEAVRFDGHQWISTPMPMMNPKRNDVLYLSCTSSTFCLAVNYPSTSPGQFVYSVFDGTSWTTAATMPPMTVTSLDCASASFCMATGYSGASAVFDGTSWTAQPVLPGRDEFFDSVSCASPTFCAAIGNQVELFEGTGWRVLPVAPGTPGMNAESVDCPVADRCFITDDRGRAYDLIGDQHITYAADLGTASGWTQLSCPSAEVCFGLAEETTHRVNQYRDGAWQASQSYDWRSGGITGLSCPSADFCSAVDGSGAAVQYDGTAWTTAERIDPAAGLTSIACPAAGNCFAVDEAGNVVRYTAGSWGTPQNIDDRALIGVQCVAADWCLALAADGSYLTFDGSAWSSSRSSPLSGASFLDCTSPTFCLAMSTDGSESMWDGTTWSNPAGAGLTGVTSVSCYSGTQCLATAGSSDRFVFWNGQAWGSVTDRGGASSSRVACVAAGRCLAVSQAGIFDYDGSSWAVTTPGANTLPWPPAQLACSGASSCLVVASHQAFPLTGR